MKKLLSQGLIAAVAVSLSLPLASQAQVMSSQEVILGPYQVTGVAAAELPRINVAAAPMQLHILNPSPEAVTFSAPELGVTQVIPPNSERIVMISQAQVAALTPGQEVAYYILDDEGNQLASSLLINETIAFEFTQVTEGQAAVTGTFEEEEAVQTTTQQQVPVRGFW